MGDSFRQWLPSDFRNNAVILYSPATPVMCHSGGVSKQDDGCAGELARHFRSGSNCDIPAQGAHLRFGPNVGSGGAARGCLMADRSGGVHPCCHGRVYEVISAARSVTCRHAARRARSPTTDHAFFGSPASGRGCRRQFPNRGSRSTSTKLRPLLPRRQQCMLRPLDLTSCG
jgi:hypothetical protein